MPVCSFHQLVNSLIIADSIVLSISTQILSRHVDDFTLVSAFFLFSLGCINMFLGLIFRASAKPKRSIESWKNESRGALPTHTDSSDTKAQPSFVVGHNSTYFPNFKAGLDRSSSERGGTYKSLVSYDEKVGYGFGTHGEKAAGLRGFLLRKPQEALPMYMSPPPSLSRNGTKRSSNSSFESPRHQNHASEGDYSTPRRSPSPHEGRQVPQFKSSPTAI